MNTASHLLFEKKYGDTPLFKNQFELVQQLLQYPSSAYCTRAEDKELYLKNQNKLKTYISQLLSRTVNRSITEDLRKSLRVILEHRFKKTNFNSEVILLEIISAIQECNSSQTKEDYKSLLQEQIKYDIINAKYISVITSRPLEISREYDPDYTSFSFQPFLLQDLVKTLSGNSNRLKSYRFNFPLQPFAEIFWKGLRRFIRFYIHKRIGKGSLLISLEKTYQIDKRLLENLKEGDPISNQTLDTITDAVINFINKEKFILVFILELPVYAIPLIALDPDETKQAKIYALYDEGNHDISITKYSREDYTLWRLFVWDKLKTISSKSYRYEEFQRKWSQEQD